MKKALVFLFKLDPNERTTWTDEEGTHDLNLGRFIVWLFILSILLPIIAILY